MAKSEIKNPDLEIRQTDSWLAWEGWSVKIPADWRPLKIDGNHGRGSMMVGNAEKAIMLVKWWRPEDRPSFSVEEWLKHRFKKLGTVPTEEPSAPRPNGFSKTAWVVELESKDGSSKTIWYGHAPAAGMVLEVVLNCNVEKYLQQKVIKKILPGLQVNSRNEETPWALYEVSFLSPQGFILNQRHLCSGDVALEFVKGKTETLLVRQVYPAGLAMKRRTYERWLEEYPFKEHRRFKLQTIKHWEHNVPRRMTGMKRYGWKQLSFPLGFCSRRFSSAVAATDEEIDRTLIAEYMSRQDMADDVVVKAIERMNWTYYVRKKAAEVHN